jgi:hypothetical protein
VPESKAEAETSHSDNMITIHFIYIHTWMQFCVRIQKHAMTWQNDNWQNGKMTKWQIWQIWQNEKKTNLTKWQIWQNDKYDKMTNMTKWQNDGQLAAHSWFLGSRQLIKDLCVESINMHWVGWHRQEEAFHWRQQKKSQHNCDWNEKVGRTFWNEHFRETSEKYFSAKQTFENSSESFTMQLPTSKCLLM